jgi:histone-lysine N-methyltransferase SETD1
LLAFEPQIDKENGSALGVLFIKFPTHEEARRCLEKENGRQGGLMRTAGLSVSVQTTKGGEKEEWRVVFDGEGLKLKAVLKEIEERKRRDREDKRRGGPAVSTPNGAGASIGATPASRDRDRDASSGTPYSGIQSPAPRKGPTQGPHLHPHPSSAQSKPTAPSQRGPTNLANSLPPKPSSEVTKAQDPDPQPPKIIDALEKARAEARERNRRASAKTSSATAGGVMGARGRTLVKYNAYQASPMNISRSPSPATAGGGIGRTKSMNMGGAGGAGSGANRSAAEKEKDRMEVVRLLAENGNDHVKVQGGVQLVASVKDEDVQAFFDGFVIDKVSF